MPSPIRQELFVSTYIIINIKIITFFVLCVFANLEASQFLPWKREALENCFWDAICNRVSAKYVGTMKCRFPLFFSPVGSGLNSVGFGWFPLGLAGTGEP